jgi:hypothetical protein
LGLGLNFSFLEVSSFSLPIAFGMAILINIMDDEGNQYRIKNNGIREARLFFCHAKEVVPQDEE